MNTVLSQKEKIIQSINTSSSLGGVSIFIIEHQEEYDVLKNELEAALSGAGYAKRDDYLALTDSLSGGEKKLWYTETNEKLDGCVLEIIAEFGAGIVSLADRKNSTGLKTARWNPLETSLVLIISRDQAERSHHNLFSYSTSIQSL